MVLVLLKFSNFNKLFKLKKLVHNIILVCFIVSKLCVKFSLYNHRKLIKWYGNMFYFLLFGNNFVYKFKGISIQTQFYIVF